MDEFAEIAARICNAKTADRDKSTPFEEALDTWLGLFFVPAITSAAKAREASGAVKRSLIKKQKQLFSAEAEAEGEQVFVDPNARFSPTLVE